MKRRIIIGITGASGVIYGIRMLEHLKNLDLETYLIVSETAKKIIQIETSYTVKEVSRFADHIFNNNELTAPLASGSFITEGMVIIPCTIKTLSAIVNSYASNLMVRAADVTIKEKFLTISVYPTISSKDGLRRKDPLTTQKSLDIV